MGGDGSGRQTKVHELQNAGQILSGAVINAAYYLRDVVSMKVKKPSRARIDVAMYVVDREFGKPKVMAEITGKDGAPLTWHQLNILAERAELLILEQARAEGILPEEVRARLLAQQTPSGLGASPSKETAPVIDENTPKTEQPGEEPQAVNN